jgi:type VI secretion system secreted protein Hcp
MSQNAIKSMALVAVVASTLAIPAESSAAVFVKFDGLDGESQDADHKDWVDVLSWSWGLSKDSRGKVCVQDLSLVKYLDSSTPDLIQSMPADTTFRTADLEVWQGRERGRLVLRMLLNGVSVSSVSTGGSGGEDRLTENISLNFSELEGTYTVLRDDGSPGEELEFTVPYSKCN